MKTEKSVIGYLLLVMDVSSSILKIFSITWLTVIAITIKDLSITHKITTRRYIMVMYGDTELEREGNVDR